MGMKEVYTHIWRCQAAVVLWIVADILAALPPEISATVSDQSNCQAHTEDTPPSEQRRISSGAAVL